MVHDAEGRDLVELGSAGPVPLRVSRALVETDLIVTVTAVPNYTFGASVLWWIGVTAVATWVLLRTRPGNWIFAVGGAQQSARQVGVPVFKTKVGLFMTTAGAGWLVGMILLFE